ncbi:MAG: hypothetical protein ACLRX4_04240 [Oscillospiraceae bacterium]
MGLIVQKFGGSSVRDRERLLRAMRIVRRTWEQGTTWWSCSARRATRPMRCSRAPAS